MKEKEEHIDVDAAWSRFERRAAGVEPAAIWKSDEAVNALSQTNQQVPRLQPDRSSSRSPVEGRMQTGRRSLRFRRWMAAGIAAALLAGLFSTSIGDKALAAMLQTFRVQHVSGVELGQSDFEKLRTALEQGGVAANELSLDQFGTLTQNGGGKPREISLQEARAVLGKEFKLPPGGKTEGWSMRLEPQMQLTLKLHVDQVNRVLKRLGGTTMFPQSADGQPIAATIPASVVMSEQAGNGKGPRRTFVQMEQPALQVPEGVDVEQVRKAVLELPFLPDSLKSKLEQTTDWKMTLFVPTGGVPVKPTVIGGHDVVVTNGNGKLSAVWLDGAQLNYLSGDSGVYATEEALLQDVKEIIGS
jgi:hypothetical protein